MNFSDSAMSAILLCSYVGMKDQDSLKPLSQSEWNKFLDNVTLLGQKPDIVIKSQDQNFLKEAGYDQTFVERIKRLISRGGIAAFELEALEKRGIDLVTPFDSDYPVLLKRKLKKKTPPVLFYCGDISLAKKIGIGIVGSRNVDEAGILFTQTLVKKAAAEHLLIYSGGARGVDTVSEQTAVESGSAAVSFVADSLTAKIRKKEILDSVINKQRLLISDVKPEAGFSVARAMNRNKYIYASSYGTFVVSSDYNKGGTWAGANEAIKNGWTRVFVWDHKNYGGNMGLIEKGAIPYELSELPVYDTITKEENEFKQMDLFSFSAKEAEKPAETTDLYDVVSTYIVDHIGEGMTYEEAAETFQVAKTQMRIWLKRLCKDSRLTCIKGRYVRNEAH